MSTDNCKFCNRLGLPFLPLRLAYVPQGANTLTEKLVKQPRIPAASLSDGVYAVRVISEGFVYIFDARFGGFWRCFGATPTGHFRELQLDSAPKEVPSFHCAQKGHAEVASLLSIQNASEAGEVWIGYSRVWWSKDVRKELKNNSGLRDELMVKINAGVVVKGGDVPEDAGLRVGSGAELYQLVGEYAKTESEFNIVDRCYASNTMTPATDRHGRADPLVERMYDISPKNAIVLALPDPVGIVQDINHWRNLKAGELAKYQGDVAKLEAHIVGDLILNVEAGIKKQGQGKTWSERYAPKVDMAKVRADKAKHEAKVKEFEKKILRASDDWCAWTSSSQFACAWAIYDGMDVQDGKAIGSTMERDFAHCVFGSGATPKEQVWWKNWLTADPASKAHPLWLAFAAGDKDVVDYLKGKISKAASVTKNAIKLHATVKTWLKERKANQLFRAAREESGMLATTMASQVQLLAKSAPDEVRVLSQRMRVVIASRIEIEITPTVQQVTLQQLVVQMHEAVWGPPKAGMTQTIMEARSLRVAQSMEGAWLGSKFTSTKVIEIETWLPEPAFKLGTQAVPKALPAGEAMLALPRPALNPWQGFTAYLKSIRNVGGGLIGLGAALNVLNIVTSYKQLEEALDSSGPKREEAITKSLYGITSGSLGILALAAEITAGAIKGRVAKAVATTAATRLLTSAGWIALGGAVLGVASAGLEAVQNGSKAWDLYREGDDDAGSAYVKVSISAVGLAFTSGALAVITAGSVFATAGATGVAATAVTGAAFSMGLGTTATGVVTMATIPVAGWIILAVGATVAIVYFTYQAISKEDTPLEKWLSRCYWRNEQKYGTTTRKKYGSLQEEMAAFQEAIYKLSVTLDWNDRLGKDEVELAVVMPGYDAKSSDYAFLLELNGKTWKHSLVDRKTSPFSEDPELKPQPPVQATIGPIPKSSKFIPMSEVLEFSEPIVLKPREGVAILAGKIRVSEDYFDGVKLKFEYWPDVINHPELKMTPQPGGINFMEKED